MRDSTFGRQEASSATYYGQSILTSLSKVTLENTALNNESSEVIAFNSGGEYQTTSACSAGWYGSCGAIGEVYSCELDVCIPCPKGKYSDSAGAVTDATCIEVPTGHYANDTGSSWDDVNKTAAGYYATISSDESEDGIGVASGATKSVRCPAGRYTASEGAYICDQCAEGTQSNSDGDGCESCSSGKFAASSGSANCETCKEGFHANETGSSKCTKCLWPTSSTSGQCTTW